MTCGRGRYVEEKLETVERRAVWAVMKTNLAAGVLEDLTSRDLLAAVAVQAVCTAYICLLVLELGRDQGEAEEWLRIGLRLDGRTEQRMRLFAERLLPDDVLRRVVPA